MKFAPKNIFLIGTLALGLLATTYADAPEAEAKPDAEKSAETAVKVLYSTNFDEFIKENPLSLIKFYAPWCGHCKTLAPEFDAASLSLKDESIALGKVDCTTETELCDKYEIKGFPTLYVFNKGEKFDFKGTRKADSIISYMKKQLLPAVTELSSDNFDQFSKSDRVVVVANYKKDSEDLKLFNEIAAALRDDYVFGSIADSDSKLAKTEFKDQGIKVYRSFDDTISFTEKLDKDALTKFLGNSAVEVLDEISGDNYQLFMKSGLPLGFMFYEAIHDEKDKDDAKIVQAAKTEAKDKIKASLLDVAKEFRDKYHFVFIDAAKFGGMAESMGIEKKWPAFAIQDQNTQIKHVMPQDQELNKDNFRKFVEGVISGDIKPTYKSEPIPETNDAPVKVLVNKNFNSIVFDETKDVLIELYAPWCGHCKKLEPTYNELAELSQKFSNVVIAKMDATLNDLPAEKHVFPLEGFPTLFFIKGKTNEVFQYEGDRSLSSLIIFIQTHSSEKIDYKYDHSKDEKKAEAEAEAEAQAEAEAGEAPIDVEDEKVQRDEL
ncbi:Protein disulfide-isomerase [Smittium culicis]|uniref:Protein disulfide-isomerase n=1 Tax=Smittium culicis TaxID=133412 RepID=A0A1R1YKU2_9FUNG|nr:Protein disulfide-isomerase [Smittium culicis]